MKPIPPVNRNVSGLFQEFKFSQPLRPNDNSQNSVYGFKQKYLNRSF